MTCGAAKAVAAALAVIVHAGAIWALIPEPAADAQNGTDAVELGSIGTGFASFATRTMPPEPQTVPAATSPERPARALVPSAAEPLRPERPNANAAEPETVRPRPVAPRVPALKPSTPAVQAETAPRTAVVAATPADRVVAAVPETTAPDRSRRPAPRPRDFVVPKRETAPRQPEQAVQQATTRKPTPTPVPKTTGQGTTDPGAAAAAPARQAAPMGTDAAAKAYPRKVYQRLARAGRVRAKAPEGAVVSFTVTAGGGLGSVSLARSSGRARFDQEALAVVRRAAPFPKPPPGAQRRFTITLR